MGAKVLAPLAIAIVILMTAVGCETSKGVSEDIQNTGENIQEGASGMTGTDTSAPATGMSDTERVEQYGDETAAENQTDTGYTDAVTPAPEDQQNDTTGAGTDTSTDTSTDMAPTTDPQGNLTY